jgi:hypothetical protein
MQLEDAAHDFLGVERFFELCMKNSNSHDPTRMLKARVVHQECTSLPHLR